jgi:spore germination cell wall hydrolase CwlJ-like protein
MQRDNHDSEGVAHQASTLSRLAARLRSALAYTALGATLAVAALHPPVTPPAAAAAVYGPPIPYTEADIHCATQAAYFEAGTDPASAAAVVHVVVNRARDARWPGSLCGVVTQRASRRMGDCQFTFSCDGKPERMTYEPILRQSVAAVEVALNSAGPDPTTGATCYHRNDTRPAWARNLQPVARIGVHVFYRC